MLSKPDKKLCVPRWFCWVTLAACVALSAANSSALDAGAAFPALSRYSLEGTLPQELSGKVIVVDFWASWCAPCKASFPTLSNVQNDFGSKGLIVIGVSVDEKASAYEQFKKRMNPTFVTLRDSDHKLATDVGVPAMPTTYVIDRSGRVRFVHQGFHDETPGRLRKEIEQLIEEKP